jgi:hypothetical protein
MRAYFDAGDYDYLKNKKGLDEETGKLLPDNERWRAPNRKIRYWIQYLLGFVAGVVATLIVFNL